jgi:hypothetical protein
MSSVSEPLSAVARVNDPTTLMFDVRVGTERETAAPALTSRCDEGSFGVNNSTSPHLCEDQPEVSAQKSASLSRRRDGGRSGLGSLLACYPVPDACVDMAAREQG